jgi:hypothetical protein
LAFGQIGNATLSGAVEDASHGAIPGAEIIVTNTATGVVKTTMTTMAGFYVMPNLIPGTYTLVVTAKGFEPKRLADIRLNVDQQASIDVQLQVGSETQEVTVTGGATPLLDTVDASVGTVVQSQQVRDLPLNGRYFTQLLELSAGSVRATHTSTYGSLNGNANPVTAGSQRNGMPAFDINGQDAQWNYYRLDGIENNERDFGGASLPISVDAIQEFKVQTANFSAEYGRSPVQVDVVTRSGTNQIHGTLFEFLRNDAVDAAQWALTGPHVKNLLKRNQFGGNIGGPIKKDRLFFFFSYDSTREVFSQPTVTTVPSVDMRNGIFPAGDIIFDPLSQQPFENNRIPQSRWNAISTKVIPFMPVPNLPGTQNTTPGGLALAPTNNYYFDPKRVININQPNVRVDYSLSAKDSFFGRYTYSPILRQGDGPLATNINGSIIFGEKAHFGGSNLSVGWFHNFSPYIINELRGGFSTNPQDFAIYDSTDYAAQLGIKPYLEPDATPGFPNFAIGSVTLGSGTYRPDRVGEKNLHLADTVTLIHAAHTIRAGGDIRRTIANTFNTEYSKGYFAFNGAQTRDRNFPTISATFCPGQTNPTGCNAGNAWADFLLGYLSQAEKGNPVPPINKYYSNWAGFVNDSWRLRQNLTISLGLRYEYQTRSHGDPPYYSNPIIKNGEFTGVVAVANDSSGKISSAVKASQLALEPQGSVITCREAGLPDNCWISDKNGWQPRVGVAWQVASNTVIRAGGGIFIGSLNGDEISEACESYPLVYTPTTPIYTSPPAGNAAPPLSLASNPFSGTNSAPTWITCGLPGRKLPSMYQWNLTVERQFGANTTLSVGYVANLSRHLDTNQMGQSVKYNIPQPVGVVLAPGQVQRVAFPNFGTIPMYETRGSASYESLQTTLRHNLSHGLSFIVTYSYSKNLEYVPWLSDSLNINIDRGPWGNDLRHNVVISPIWQLPFGKGRHWAPSNRVIDKLIGGWEANTIISVHGGFPFTPTLSPDVDLLHQNGTVTQNRPDRICNGSLSNPSPFQWFNPSCFTMPVEPTTPGAALRPGTSGFGILRGPGTFAQDLGLSKITALKERASLEFRTDFFNIFNHPVLGLPNPGINPAANPATEGMIIAADSLPRIIQFALKLHF